MISDIIKTQDKVVIIGPELGLDIVEREFGDTLKYFKLGDNMLYYHEMVSTKLGLEMDHESFEPVMRMLWAKNVMYENYYRTNNHMFVTLSKLSGNIGNDLKMVITLAGQDDTVVVKGGEYTGVFDDDKNRKLIFGGESIPTEVPQLDIVWGNMEQIEWLSVNIEGHLLAFIRDGIISTSDVDYGIIPFMNTPEKFKVY